MVDIEENSPYMEQTKSIENEKIEINDNDNDET